MHIQARCAKLKRKRSGRWTRHTTANLRAAIHASMQSRIDEAYICSNFFFFTEAVIPHGITTRRTTTMESPDRVFKWREILTPKPQTSNTSSSKVTAPYLHSTTAAPSLQGHFVRPHIAIKHYLQRPSIAKLHIPHSKV